MIRVALSGPAILVAGAGMFHVSLIAAAVIAGGCPGDFAALRWWGCLACAGPFGDGVLRCAGGAARYGCR